MKDFGRMSSSQAIKGAGIDIFHGPRYYIPKNLSCPAVVTVHDLGFKKFPQFVTKKTAAYFDAMVRSSVKRSRKIIAPSHATKADLVDIYGVDEKKVAVIYEGSDEIFSPGKSVEAIERTKSKLAIRRKFILFSGTIEPRKNLINLLEAYKATKAKNSLDLVIAGGFGWLYGGVLKKAKDPDLKDRVIFTDYIPSEDLACLYNACEAFVFPSFYEGFGLPVLEAMRCGAAVITSNTSSLKGLFADASYQVDPYKQESIARGIDDVLSNTELRDGLKTRALAKSKEFSWREAASRTLALYREVLI